MRQPMTKGMTMRTIALAAILAVQPALAFERVISIEPIPLQSQSTILLPEDTRFLDVEIFSRQARLWVDYSEDRTVPIVEWTICVRKLGTLAPEESEFIGRARSFLFYLC